MKSRVVVIVLLAGIIALAILGVRVVSHVRIVSPASRPKIDMTGGTILTYEVDARGLSNEEKKGLSQRMITALQKRVDPDGREALVWRPLGDTRLEVAMPVIRSESGHLNDPNDLQRLLQNPGVLEFRVLATRDLPREDAAGVEQYRVRLQEKGPQSAPGDQYVWCETEGPQGWLLPNAITGLFAGRLYVLAGNDPNESLLQRPGRNRWGVKSARPTTDATGRQAIDFTLDRQGGELFYQLTARNIGRPLAILLDDRVISAPHIHSAIRDRGIIVGSFTPTQISDMVRCLTAGPLPARLIQPPLSVKMIGGSTENTVGAGTVHTSGPNSPK